MIIDFIEHDGHRFIRAEGLIEWVNECDEASLCSGQLQMKNELIEFIKGIIEYNEGVDDIFSVN